MLGLIPTVPVVVGQSSDHVRPQLVTRGQSCVAVPAAGSVLIQVFVKKDSSFDVRQVIRSTNHDDDAAALDIARNSTYKAATTNGQPVDEFYDYQLDFTAATPASALTGDLCAAETMVRNGQFAGAKEKLTAYLVNHPDDRQAYLYLGLANAFGKDPAAATAAFDKAGPIDPRYAGVAGQAYLDRAQDLFKNSQFPQAAAAAARAVEIQPSNLTAYYLRGLATARTDPAAALLFLEKAHALAAEAKLAPANVAQIDLTLVGVYGETGDFAKAAALAKEAGELNPARADEAAQAIYTAYFNSGVALANAGKHADAVARFEAGASAVPAHAATLLGEAAQVLATDKPPDWKKVKAEADKALAADQADGMANYVEALALANDGKPKDAIPFLNRAKSSALYTSNAQFAKQVDDSLKALAPAAKY